MPDNVIKEIKVAHDSDNLYFYIKTKDQITKHQEGKTNWMNLFLGVEGNSNPSWEGYHYVINRHPTENVTSIEAFADCNFVKIADACYTLTENILQLKIPRNVIGLDSDNFTIYFKVADSVEKEDDIMDYYVSGESVPMGRLSFTYGI